MYLTDFRENTRQDVIKLEPDLFLIESHDEGLTHYHLYDTVVAKEH